MEVEVLFFTQIASIIAFILALFVLYKTLVAQKDAVIQLLKEEGQRLKDRLADSENQSPDLLLKRYVKRIKAFERELELLTGEKEVNEERVAELERSLKQAQRNFTNVEPVMERAQMVVKRSTLGSHARQLLRSLYGKCQVCGEHESDNLHTCHIRPVVAGGTTELSNLLLLCPNHHALFDMGRFAVSEDFSLLGSPGELCVHTDHNIDGEALRFHRERIYLPNE